MTNTSSQPLAFDDIALATEAKQGDKGAFTELVNRYAQRVFRVARHITKNDQDAEDVLQDTFLFADTIRHNISYGRPGASDAEIEAAARRARAHEFIAALPDGYDTMLQEGASNLSRGQRQLLSIARALLKDPRILVLDEATSNVDTRTEMLIQAALGELLHGRTSFVIAHRLSTVQRADVIYVIDDGEVVERGSHDELLRMDGTYARIYHSQFELTTAAQPAH